MTKTGDRRQVETEEHWITGSLNFIVFLAIAAVAYTDWIVVPNISLGYLYVLPIALSALINPLALTITLAVGSTVLADLFAGTLCGAGLEEIMDDFHRTVETQHPFGFRFKVRRDGSHRVGMDQGVVNGRAVAGIASEQCCVGAVKGCDDAGLLLRRQH